MQNKNDIGVGNTPCLLISDSGGKKDSVYADHCYIIL